MAVDLAAAIFRAKSYYYNKKNKTLSPISPRPEAYYLIIRFPSSQTWKIFFRLVLLALAVASFPLMVSKASSVSTSHLEEAMTESSSDGSEPSSTNVDQILTLLFRDLANEGLMKKTEQHRAVFLSNAKEGEKGFHQVLTDYNMEHIPLNDLEKQSTLLDRTVDFVFTYNFPASLKFIDRALKTGGVATVILPKDDPSTAFYKPSNYRVMYMRRFNVVAMAMKKTEPNTEMKVGGQRKLFGYASEAKKAALQNLEDVLLEPPRAASGKSRVYLKRTRYLPDLMGDSLESYPRRVFIDVGLPEKDGGSGTDWFPKNYPTRNKNFEMYKIETVNEGSSAPQTEMSEWLRKNVKEEEYVVMKAEAEVVEEMMRSKAILLVDELFLECKPHGLKQEKRRSRRAYWECLALYGKLRDEGVAVHQWWG
ncbi:uncharacterized protein LOC130734154 [Lotus japonicus]|uniref:uncharacterized protein LOC130734154 n=1 Tax=Lotus japonicus TaxID=34305 RepID=UPI00258DB8FA|nr:uncharacterized protein LOC130734154 [Lotus japonicus]